MENKHLSRVSKSIVFSHIFYSCYRLCCCNINRCCFGAFAEMTDADVFLGRTDLLYQSVNHLSAERSCLRTQPQSSDTSAPSLISHTHTHTHICACPHTFDHPPPPEQTQTHADATDVHPYHTCTHRRGGICWR